MDPHTLQIDAPQRSTQGTKPHKSTKILCAFCAFCGLIYDCKRAYGERAKLPDLHGHREEFEAAVRKISEAAEVFDDWDIVAEEDCMRRAMAVVGGVDVE